MIKFLILHYGGQEKGFDLSRHHKLDCTSIFVVYIYMQLEIYSQQVSEVTYFEVFIKPQYSIRVMQVYLSKQIDAKASHLYPGKKRVGAG